MSPVEAVNGSPEGLGTIHSTEPDRMGRRGTIPARSSVRPAATALPALTVSLVIPARNEARNIAWVLEQIQDTVTEIILVDGNSTDVTLTTARSYRPDIRVVPQEGVGKGSALRTGFLAATGDVIVMIDADGSMSPQEIGHYLHFLANGYDFVKGSRFISGGGSLDITRIRGLPHVRAATRATAAWANGSCPGTGDDPRTARATRHKRYGPRVALGCRPVRCLRRPVGTESTAANTSTSTIVHH
jgi:cellulose synthase/poly-beta-1,6-N-acetylglucosamine synthase-like glycosyltransferase